MGLSEEKCPLSVVCEKLQLSQLFPPSINFTVFPTYSL